MKNADFISVEKFANIDLKDFDEYINFLYEESLDKVNCAKIFFENKKYKFEYIIASDEKIISFKKLEKANI